jgi:hypothetical protein
MFNIIRHPALAVVLLAALLAGMVPVPVQAAAERRSGFAAHYRPGLMQRVARTRGLEIVACMVASPHHRIGTWLSVTSAKRNKTLDCRVTDVPQARHRAAVIKRKIVVELDFESAKVLCGITRPRERPPQACPVVVTLTRRG